MTNISSSTAWAQPAQALAAPHHRLAVQGRIGLLDLRFETAFHAAWTVLFGPSGCGKSTLLRALCGLTHGLHIDLARTAPGGASTILQDSHRSVPTPKRRLAYAPQQALLFPHLTVRQNVAFAETVRTQPEHLRDLVHEAMSLFDLERFAARLPRELSGGERQRVSLARAAAVPDAALVLLDEPFAGVDRALRDDLLPRLQQWFSARSVPVISVTHDVDEVFLLRADVIRLREGMIVAHGAPEDVLADEAERVLRALPGSKSAPETR